MKKRIGSSGERTQKHVEFACDGIARLLQLVIGVPAAVSMGLVMAILALAGVLVTAYPRLNNHGGPLMYVSALGELGVLRQVVLPLVIAFVWIAVLLLLKKVLASISTRAVVISMLIVALGIQLVWTAAFMTNEARFPDVIQLDTLAKSFLRHEPGGFVGIDEWVFPYRGEANGYLLRTPYQAGGLLLFATLYKLFGLGNLCSIQVLNIVANELSLLAVVGIASNAMKNDATRRESVVKMTAVMACTFIPFLMSATFAYPNAFGLALALGACWISTAAWSMQNYKSTHELGAFIASMLLMWVAVMVKATIVLMAIVLFISWFLHALRSHHLWEIVTAILGLLLCFNASCLPVTIVERNTGVRLGDGQPLLTNVAMGLTWSDVQDLPGWYGNTAFNCFNECEGDMSKQKAWVTAALEQRLTEFTQNPEYAVSFFGLKLATEWLDPSYQTLFFSQLCLPDDSMKDVGAIAKTVKYGSKRGGYVQVMAVLDGMQSVLYAMLAVGFIQIALSARGRRNVDVAWLMLCGMSLCGFLCYIFWEAQSMYILPFVVAMLPVAGAALARVPSGNGR